MKLLNPSYFTESKFFQKIGKTARYARIIVIYPALILYYLMKEKSVPLSGKTMIAAALAYFIFPADSIPDITPIIGYSDDLAILLVSISRLMKYITPEILEKVKLKIVKWFGDIQEIQKQEDKLLHQMNPTSYE